jgi:hypothetical protein
LQFIADLRLPVEIVIAGPELCEWPAAFAAAGTAAAASARAAAKVAIRRVIFLSLLDSRLP